MNVKNKEANKGIDWNLFEHIIIYNALVNEAYLASIVDVVQPIFFSNIDIRTIFDVISSFYKERNCTPNTTEIKLRLITPEQKEAFKRIVSEFANIDKNYNYDDLMKNTERFFRERAVYHAILKTASEHSNNEIDTSKIYDTFEKACNISIVNDLGCNYFDDIDKHIEDLKKVNTVIPTGFQWLDERIGGGVQEHGRALYIVSGVTNSGKSILLGNIGANFLSLDKTVVIISLEMSEAIYAKRISSQLSQIPLNRLVNQSDALKAFIQDYRSHHPQSKLFIKEYAPKEITVNHIKAYIKQLINKRRIKPDVIIVDYVNLIEASPATGDSYTDVKKVSEQLRALSYIFSVPVISATQINRCLCTKTTYILDKDNKPILLKDANVGDTIKGNNGNVTITKKYPPNIQKCYKITTKSGKYLTCSANHLFPVGQDIYKSINTGLKIGDKIPVLSATK